MSILGSWHRAAGALLLALTVLPAFRMMRGRWIGVTGRDTLAAAERSYELLLLGSLIVMVVAVLASRFVAYDSIRRILRAFARALSTPSRPAFAVAAGVVCGVLTAAFAALILDGKPNLVDAMVQLLQARFIAEGQLSGPTQPSTVFWHLQNSMNTPAGWVSHFPPGFPALLAVGHLIGAPWVIGALSAAAAVFFLALAAERLVPERTAAVRFGVLLAAISPFFIGLAGAQMNHVGAAAFTALAIYAAVRGASSGSALWAIVAGAALGAAFSIRPLTALAAVLPVVAVALYSRSAGGWSPPIRSIALGLIGAAPFGLAVAWYNARFFGSALRFGYEYAYGPAVGLGFHVDPWGNAFGPIEAVGFTSTDLTTLGQYLLETPISAVLIVGLYLLTTKRLAFGEKVLAAWALVPVAANFFYWHHGVFMGPRMLSEVAPAWCVLVGLGAAAIVTSIDAETNFRGYYPRTAAAIALGLSFTGGALYLAPERLLGYRTFMPSSRIAPPTTPDSSLVFVHGAWSSRIVMRLAAAGMRLDSVETAMRENPTCQVDAFSRLYAAGERSAQRLPALTFQLDARKLLPYVSVREEYTIRTDGRPLTGECLRELDADRLGTLDVSPMLWQVRVPGLRSGGAIVVRDMGPEENQEMLAAYSTLTPMMYYRPAPEADAVLVPYTQGVRELWR